MAVLMLFSVSISKLSPQHLLVYMVTLAGKRLGE